MGRIIVLIDPLSEYKGLLDFTLYISQLTKSSVAGIFIENTASDKLVQKDLHGFAIGFTGPEEAKNLMIGKALIEETITAIGKKFQDLKIPFTIHRVYGIQSDEVVFESRYADLLLIDADMYPGHRIKRRSTTFVREIIKKSECPVMLTPQNPGDIQEILFCYDGTQNAAQALKQFTYLFPQFKDRQLVLLEDSIGVSDIPLEKRLEEWIRTHYIHFRHERFSVANAEIASVFNKDNTIIVMGSLTKKAKPGFFIKLAGTDQLNKTTHAVFIA